MNANLYVVKPYKYHTNGKDMHTTAKRVYRTYFTSNVSYLETPKKDHKQC